MKQKYLKIKLFLAGYKSWPTDIKNFFIDLWGLVKSIWIYLFRDIRRPAIMNGFYAFYFAKKYAVKRTRRWKPSWDQSGRIQLVTAFGEQSLIICSRMELKLFKKKRLLSKKVNPKKILRYSYFKTTI